MKTTQGEGFKLMQFNSNVNRPFWSGAAENAVVIEANAYKSDVINKAHRCKFHNNMLRTAELVRLYIN